MHRFSEKKKIMASKILERRLDHTVVFQKKIVSESSIEKRYVLFYLKNNDHCKEALDALKKNKFLVQVTVLQSVTKIRKKPWWLDGVPTLLDRNEKSLLKGNECIHFLKKHKNRTVDDLFQPSCS